MYLVFDVSAAGRPKNWKADATDTFNWPRLVHLAWMLFDEDYKKLESGNELIQPDGFELDKESAEFHHLTQDELEKEGRPLKEVLQEFSDVVDKADIIIAHNLRFNQNIMVAEFTRMNMPQRLQASESYCIMQEATYFCKIKGKYGSYKWPTLTELYQAVFGKKFTKPNYAAHDVVAAAKCFFVLLEAGEIELL
jgi:DNA polymerase III alpha subunit (gram-positive type)